MVQTSPSFDNRSSLSRAAHVLERLGLAMAGASCGLFVAAVLIRANVEMGSGFAAFVMMIYGAAGFYLGIDLPPMPHDDPPPNVQARTDIVDLMSAIGTFLAALASVLSVYVIIAGEQLSLSVAALIGVVWALGATMQIAAGIAARVRRAAVR